jgi:hypothetical protein
MYRDFELSPCCNSGPSTTYEIVDTVRRRVKGVKTRKRDKTFREKKMPSVMERMKEMSLLKAKILGEKLLKRRIPRRRKNERT